jgi:hypothetical protein
VRSEKIGLERMTTVPSLSKAGMRRTRLVLVERDRHGVDGSGSGNGQHEQEYGAGISQHGRVFDGGPTSCRRNSFAGICG